MQQDEQKEVYVRKPISLQISISTIRKFILFSKRYPIPAIAIIGLIVGTVVHYIFNDEETGQWIWFITLVIGGAPIVFETIKEMLHGRFASDIVGCLL